MDQNVIHFVHIHVKKTFVNAMEVVQNARKDLPEKTAKRSVKDVNREQHVIDSMAFAMIV
jgi:hypothetical protein